MKTKEAVVVGDCSQNEFEVDEPEEVEYHSDDKGAPSAAAKTSSKRGRLVEHSLGRKTKMSEVEDDNDEEEEKILPKKARGSSKPKPSTSAKGKPRKEEEEELHNEDVADEEEEVDEEEVGDKEKEDEYDEDEENINQGPNAIPVKKFTSGAFVILKTDMVGNICPPLWKIDGKVLLQKYIPFEHDGKVLYKNEPIFSRWSSRAKFLYYSAPVKCIRQTCEEHIVELFKDQVINCFSKEMGEKADNFDDVEKAKYEQEKV